ncbi:MAG: type II secretion system protein [Candidatus Obscuribacterales bacterium]|nr:type II secretion system protein [Candidatus Obscuribacterales bacterium]
MPGTKRVSRNQRGIYLIELLSALVISGMLSVVLGDSIARTIQLNTRTEKNMIAPQIAQNLLERLRATPYASWPASGSQFNINIDPFEGGAISAPPVQARAAMLDASEMKYLTGNPSVNLPGYKFNGIAEMQYSNNALNTARSVVITVKWSDSTASNRTYVLNAECSVFGI